MISSVGRTSDAFLRAPAAVAGMQLRHKTQKFKQKIARHRPLKTPTNIAMDHFDFYYGPMFGKRWPSVRLGLLTPNKYIAVVNTFSRSCDASESILAELGAFDLISKLAGSQDKRKLERRRQLAEAKGTQILDPPVEDELQETSTDDDVLGMRDESGLHTFQSSGRTFTMGDAHSGKLSEERRNITITGLEGQFARLPKKEDVIVYPEKLKLFVFHRDNLADFPSPDKDSNSIPSWWLLDGGSVVPVLALSLSKGETLLDMCAAPGGKSLLATQTMLLDRIVCNDFKMSRLGQLRSALASFIPMEFDIANRVILKKKDGSNLVAWDELDMYDKVLVDAPCTTDRLAANVDEGNIFSTSLTSARLDLPHLQTKLLINALRSLRRGGSVVYSTCSLSPTQNEAVVENAVAVAADKFGIEAIELSLTQLENQLGAFGLFRFSDQCRRGSLVLPFLPSNFGPMYVCKLQRTK